MLFQDILYPSRFALIKRECKFQEILENRILKGSVLVIRKIANRILFINYLFVLTKLFVIELYRKKYMNYLFFYLNYNILMLTIYKYWLTIFTLIPLKNNIYINSRQLLNSNWHIIKFSQTQTIYKRSQPQQRNASRKANTNRITR